MRGGWEFVGCSGLPWEEIGHTKEEHLEGFCVPALQSGVEKVRQRQYLFGRLGQASGLRERGDWREKGAQDTAESLELL